MGFSKSYLVIISSLTNMPLIETNNHFVRRGFEFGPSLFRKEGSGEGFQTDGNGGWAETWRQMVSHPRFYDAGNGKVSQGPENPEKMWGASFSSLWRYRVALIKRTI